MMRRLLFVCLLVVVTAACDPVIIQATTAVGPQRYPALTFTTGNFPQRYGTCATVMSPTLLLMNVTSSCNPGGDGHYRADWANKGTFTAGVTSCVSIPVAFPGGTQAIGSGSWWQFAEAKTPSTAWADWGLYITNRPGGGNQFDFRMNYVTGPASNGTSHPSLWRGADPTSGWNTFVVCSNYATTNSGFLTLYLNGNQVFSTSGVYILKGQTVDDLVLNDYTGGSPTPNSLVHGAPKLGPTLADVEQSGGWTAMP